MFTIDPQSGLLEPAQQLTSPHCDERPIGTPIDAIIIHNISLPPGEFGTGAIEQFFCGKLDSSAHPYFDSIKELKVSAHLVIKRSGDIIQFVPFNKRAWHAGLSELDGRPKCNDFSIGIELEGTDTQPYEEIQYARLGQVIRLLMHTYPEISLDRITGHENVAPGRKTDPGPAFNWVYLKKLLV